MLADDIIDRRGSTLLAYETRREPGSSIVRLLTRCDDRIASQVGLVLKSLEEPILREAAEQYPGILPTYLTGILARQLAEGDWTHEFEIRPETSSEVIPTLEVLKRVLSLAPPANADIALSLGWYTARTTVGGLERTNVGNLLYRAKHRRSQEFWRSRLARRRLVRMLTAVVSEHALLNAATIVTAPVGSGSDGRSFGEALARAVARRSGKQYLPLKGDGARPERKAGSHVSVPRFEMRSSLHGATVIVVDDVFRTGATLQSAGSAVRAAGAASVLCVTATRTSGGR